MPAKLRFATLGYMLRYQWVMMIAVSDLPYLQMQSDYSSPTSTLDSPTAMRTPKPNTNARFRSTTVGRKALKANNRFHQAWDGKRGTTKEAMMLAISPNRATDRMFVECNLWITMGMTSMDRLNDKRL